MTSGERRYHWPRLDWKLPVPKIEVNQAETGRAIQQTAVLSISKRPDRTRIELLFINNYSPLCSTGSTLNILFRAEFCRVVTTFTNPQSG